MSERVTIKQVWDKPPRDYSFQDKNTGATVHLREFVFTSQDGKFIAFSQKPESDPPTDGLVLEFDRLEPPPEGKKLWKGKGPKRVQHEFDYSQSPSQPSLQPVSKYEVQDVTQRLIIRQNALNRALELAVAMNGKAPELSISETAQIWVDFFEQLIWEAASPGHEQKVLEWAGVLEDAPAGGEGTNEGQPPIPPSDVTETSPPAGATPSDGLHTVTDPSEAPEEGGGGSASPSTLAQVLRNKRQHNVPDLVFSTFLTSMGVENVNLLSEDEAQLVLAWIANGDGQVAA